MGGDRADTPPRVAVIGANGHGRWHRRVIAPLHAAGRLRLVALVDVRPVEDDPAAPVPPGSRCSPTTGRCSPPPGRRWW
ncbi:hypothetical protein NKG94_10965 [Micromonospora sp. M12]